jgi:hypothetical protein
VQLELRLARWQICQIQMLLIEMQNRHPTLHRQLAVQMQRYHSCPQYPSGSQHLNAIQYQIVTTRLQHPRLLQRCQILSLCPTLKSPQQLGGLHQKYLNQHRIENRRPVRLLQLDGLIQKCQNLRLIENRRLLPVLPPDEPTPKYRNLHRIESRQPCPVQLFSAPPASCCQTSLPCLP